jgi:glycosyltransferase involved in cell wall biosynthesis
MLRLAFIVHTFQAGGLERCVARLASRIDRSRFQPVIICLDRSGSAVDWLEAKDVPVFELRKRPGNDPGLVFRFSRLLRAERIQLVHSHNWGSLIETVLARLIGSVPLHVHAERGLELSELRSSAWRRRVREWMSRVGLASTDAVVAVSGEIRARLISSGVPADRIHSIPNGIDPIHVADPIWERFRIRQELGIDSSTILACSVSRMTPVKNLAAAIDSLGVLSGEGQDIHLVLVGDGPDRDGLERRAQSLGIARNVHLVGEQLNVGSWLAASDMYLNTSVYEGMSQAILEAMGAGLPLVVTDVGESANLVLGSSPCGRVIPCGNVGAFAAAVKELSEDAGLRRKLGSRGRQRQLEKYSQERMVRNYENLYNRLALERVPSLTRVTGWAR